MKARWQLQRWWCLVAAVAGLAGLKAQPAEAVQLPPLLIEESAKLPVWLYAKTAEGEYLSRCSTATTRGYAEMRQARMQLVQWMVPREFFVRMDVPAVTILYSQKLKNSAAEELMGEVMRSRSSARGGPLTGNSVATAVPNMMLDDVDVVGVFAYVDERAFDRNRLSVATDYVRYMLGRRVPALPTWLMEGIVETYAMADFVDSPITLRPLTWLTRAESGALAESPERPRALLPAAEFFSAQTWREEARRSLRGQTLEAQSRLFVRWALDPKHGVREAFWRFAARACEEPVTEAMFEQSFGFGFSDWRDRLSDYLPEAAKHPLRLEMVGAAKLPAVEVRTATPSEVARLRGEWERLAIGFVQRRYPEVAERYATQALRTLRRAYESGDRDARLFATLGLCELEGGKPADARMFLEQAVAERVVRPRAYYELARLRWAESTGRLTNAGAEGGTGAGVTSGPALSAMEVEAVAAPLRSAFGQAPAHAKSFALLADVWARTEEKLPAGDRAWLLLGAKWFPHEPAVCLRIARALARHGETDRAVAVLGESFTHIIDDATRRQFAELYAALTKASAPPRAR